MSTAEVRCRDGAKTLLPRSIPNLQLDSLAVDFHVLDLEVDSDGGDERWGEGVVSVTQQQARFAHAGVSDHEQLDLHVIGGCLAHCFKIMMLIKQYNELLATVPLRNENMLFYRLKLKSGRHHALHMREAKGKGECDTKRK